MKQFLNVIPTVLFISILISLSSCYNQLALTGGPRDEVPPQLDTANSISNNLIQFVKQDIFLQFDEYVDLRDANKQIVISPPLDFPPQVSSRLKKVKFVFHENEVLKENATYVINFGKSIRDFTEGNELLNFTYVFSTGDYIDSLSLSGTVTDAKTGKPKEDALVLLYIDNQDSIVFKERPFYFARTDKSGIFQVNNLRSDSFKVVTMNDQNLNYLYDPATDEIGFLDSLAVVNDSSKINLLLEIFKEETKPRYKSYEIAAQGKARIDFEGSTHNEAIKVLDSLDHYITYTENDQFLTLWYTPRQSKSIRYEVSRGDQLDTIQARINTRTVDTLDGRTVINKFNFDPKIGLHPKLPLILSFDRPVQTMNWELIYFVDTLDRDTLQLNLDSVQTDYPTIAATISHNWPQERVLQCTFLPGSLNDFFGMSNDTIIKWVRIAQEVDFGTIKLKPVGFDTLQYVFELLKDEKVIQRQLYNPGQEELIFRRLVPAAYTLKIIEDKLPNGKWDPGNYLEKRQSERIYQLPLSELRANWIMEEEINLSEIISRAKFSPDKEETLR